MQVVPLLLQLQLEVDSNDFLLICGRTQTQSGALKNESDDADAADDDDGSFLHGSHTPSFPPRLLNSHFPNHSRGLSPHCFAEHDPSCAFSSHAAVPAVVLCSHFHCHLRERRHHRPRLQSHQRDLTSALISGPGLRVAPSA